MDAVLYQAYSALSARLDALSVLANNLSNANSTGYKADRLFEEILGYMAAEAGTGDGSLSSRSLPLRVQQGVVDFSAGPVLETNNPLHVALLGEGFFTVQTPRGTRYTRQGNFQVSSRGELQTADGMPVLGEGGPIQLPPGEIKIDALGNVSVNGAQVGRLALVDFKNQLALTKEGMSLFRPQDPDEPAQSAASPNLRQGALEGSNVNPIAMMSELIALQREFDSMQRAIQLSMNDMTQRIIEEAAKK